MASRILNTIGRGGAARLALLALLLLSLYVLTAATENTARFGRLYVWLLLFNAVILVGLLFLIGHNVLRLLKSLNTGQVGARLTARIVTLFAVLAVVPGLVVYGFSMQFLRSGIDSWFDVRVEQALDDALELSQASLDLRMRDLLRRVQAAAESLRDVPEPMLPLTLSDLRARLDASELALLGANGRIIAASSSDTEEILPNRPEAEVLLQLRQGRPYVGLDPIESKGLHIRTVVPAPDTSMPGNSRIFQALFPVSPRLDALAGDVQQAFADYRELAYLREPLKDSFILTLSLVLLVSLMFALWTAFYLARRLVAPLSSLAEGTKALAAGEYGTQLPPAGRDEIGFLVRSFNDMSRSVAQARDAARRGQVLVESERAYLETVLGRLSSGVLTLDQEGRLRTANRAAATILSLPLERLVGESLGEIAETHRDFEPFAALVAERLAEAGLEWREQFTVDTVEGRRVLMCSGSGLPGGRLSGGHVIVFDDVTTLIQAQRDAAWGEVARRLAHEIRNPLTPIQLAAERLQHKIGERVSGDDADLLDRSTRTIIQQVDTLKAMVQAFSEYARPPVLDIHPVDLGDVVRDVVELYRLEREAAHFELDLQPDLPLIPADPNRLRQLLNNLIRNALEAGAGEGECRVIIRTRLEDDERGRRLAIVIEDNGPGFSDEVLDQIFEPYVTTKPRGTGLGLPIVKKIVEEHNGRISARNTGHGAVVKIRLPLPAAAAPPGEDGWPMRRTRERSQ